MRGPLHYASKCVNVRGDVVPGIQELRRLKQEIEVPGYIAKTLGLGWGVEWGGELIIIGFSKNI